MGQGFGDTVERWLIGGTLEDKLVTASSPAVDFAPPPSPISAPGRPPGLELARRGARLPAEIRVDEDRGRALHVFANHELQAIELFAWAILRFPETPLPFRRGMAAIVAEEQRHLRMYLARMAELGIEFGSLPLSGFLWNALTRCETPLQFAVGMGMGFEQANLDHARLWSSRFAAAGDAPSSQLMATIAEDEVGHVRHGTKWFEQWRDPSLDRKTAWISAFVPPMTPARSRGTIFARDLRVRATIAPELIDLVQGFSASKGRPPDVFWFNPGAEAHAEAGRDVGTEPAIVREIAADLAPVLGHLAGPDDVVLVDRELAPWYLADLAVHVPVPEFRTSLPDGPIRTLRPWAATPDTARIGSVPLTSRTLFMRTALAAWLRDRWPDVDGWISKDELPIPASGPDVPAAVARILPCRVVVKSDFSASGRNRRWFDAVPPPMSGSFVVERWFERVADFSVQFTMDDGPRVDGIGRFLTDDRGQYRGAILGDPTAGLDSEVARFVGGRLAEWLHRAVELVAPWLSSHRFTGPAGIDAMVVRTDRGLRFHPIVELNPRMTMGRVALALSRRVSRAAVWHFLGVESRPWLQSLPRDTWEGDRLVEGRWWTTDPTAATRVVTAVIAARHAANLPVWPGDPPSR